MRSVGSLVVWLKFWDNPPLYLLGFKLSSSIKKIYNVDTSRHGNADFSQHFYFFYINLLEVLISFYMSDRNPLTIFPQVLIRELGRIMGMF